MAWICLGRDAEGEGTRHEKHYWRLTSGEQMIKYNHGRIGVRIPFTVKGSMCLTESANDFIIITLYLILRATNPENDSEGSASHPEQPECVEAIDAAS